MKEVARNEALLYVLERGEGDALFFTVTCGGVGMFDVTIRLSAEEVDRYTAEGATFLDRLSIKIGRDAAMFAGRAVERRAGP